MKYIFIFIAIICTVSAYEQDDVARTIFMEAGPKCSTLERLYVASVIKNRVGHIGFNKPKSMFEVVSAKRQFCGYTAKSNKAWEYRRFFKSYIQAVLLSNGKFNAIPRVVYFHDKSITKPKCWDNRYWKTFVVKETQHFIFYGVTLKKSNNDSLTYDKLAVY